MKTLDLSFSSITSLEGLAVQPKIENLILDGSMIGSFKNASSISNITKISLQNTPVSKIPNYKISLLLVCGKNLTIIDGRVIPNRIRQKAETYPPVAARLVDCGWIAEYPCPSEEDLKDLCISYGIKYDIRETRTINEIPLFEEKDIDEVISKYSQRHQNMLKQAQEKLTNYEVFSNDVSISVTDSAFADERTELFGFADDQYHESQCEEESFLDFDPNRLSYRVSEIIRRYGFDIEEGDPVSTIVSALSHIFEVAEGQDIEFPQVLMDANAVVSDEESEEESLMSEEFQKESNLNMSQDQSSPSSKNKVVFEETIPKNEYPNISSGSPASSSQKSSSLKSSSIIQSNEISSLSMSTKTDNLEEEEMITNDKKYATNEDESSPVSEPHTTDQDNEDFLDEEEEEIDMAFNNQINDIPIEDINLDESYDEEDDNEIQLNTDINLNIDSEENSTNQSTPDQLKPGFNNQTLSDDNLEEEEINFNHSQQLLDDDISDEEEDI
ncbi:hypothetical protein TRFO_13215 [Tritrichomonas foetus]|uniref:Uncharacterized protein n=1 Tax=Tritrichomonas foetus TaxID=1144522 RepID=A0A1J4L321_9EUKA|nr:hypothetical protein TRFO_13215 [Tritrichomonas foetus]|eukprot:OHT16372.1 hypothetical protein TRFO_13215 [Tritrichomonas foetus]